jgi:hypothetical protein
MRGGRGGRGWGKEIERDNVEISVCFPVGLTGSLMHMCATRVCMGTCVLKTSQDHLCQQVFRRAFEPLCCDYGVVISADCITVKEHAVGNLRISSWPISKSGTLNLLSR